MQLTEHCAVGQKAKWGPRAKTGTLDGVICLSGYVVFADGTPGVFSILMNDVPGRPWKIWALQDQIIEALLRTRPVDDLIRQFKHRYQSTFNFFSAK